MLSSSTRLVFPCRVVLYRYCPAPPYHGVVPRCCATLLCHVAVPRCCTAVLYHYYRVGKIFFVVVSIVFQTASYSPRLRLISHMVSTTSSTHLPSDFVFRYRIAQYCYCHCVILQYSTVLRNNRIVLIWQQGSAE